MRQSPGPGACGHVAPSVVSCLCHLCAPSPGEEDQPGLGSPSHRAANLSLPPPSLPTSGSSLSPPLAFSSISHTPPPLPLGFYIYFLLSVFSVCTILWGCDRGEGAGHVGITSVYVPRPPATQLGSGPLFPPTPPRGSPVISPGPRTPPFLCRPHPLPPTPWSPILMCCLCVAHVCPGGVTPPYPPASHPLFRAPQAWQAGVHRSKKPDLQPCLAHSFLGALSRDTTHEPQVPQPRVP